MDVVDILKDENSVEKREQSYGISASSSSRKRRGKKRCNFKPPVNNKRLKEEMTDIKTNSNELENVLPTGIKENILQKSESVMNSILDEKNISPKVKDDSEHDKNSENNTMIKDYTINFMSDNVVKSLDSIFFPEDTNDKINYSSSKNNRNCQMEQQYITPSPKKMNEFKTEEENVVERYNLLEKEKQNDQAIIKVLTEKGKYILSNKTLVPNSSLGDGSEQNEMKELTDNDEKSAFIKLRTINLDNKNKENDENNISETNVCLNEQKVCVNLEYHTNIKDFTEDKNKKNKMNHENLDNTENLKNKCINMQKNSDIQCTESVKDTKNTVSLFQRNDSPVLMDELLNDIKKADAIINLLSNSSNKENCTVNGDMTNIQFLNDIKFNSRNEDNGGKDLQDNCNEKRNGLDNFTNCEKECDHSKFNGTYQSLKHDKNTFLENACVSDNERGFNIFHEEVSTQMIGSMDSVDETLVQKEKKLTLLYMSALDYDKEILTKDRDELDENIETKDYKNRGKYLNDDVTMNIEADSPEIKRMEINLKDVNKNIINNSNSISSTEFGHNSPRDKNEFKTSEKNYFQPQNLSDTNAENEIRKKTMNEVIHDHDCTNSICNAQNQIEENITRCDFPENEDSATCDTQQPEAHTSKTSYIIREESTSVSLAENSNSDEKIYMDGNVPEKKMEKADDCIKNKCLEIPEMSLLVTATDYFKLEKAKNTETVNETENNNTIESMNSAHISLDQSDNNENVKENDMASLDGADSFDMEDDFDLTASQLSMIEVDEKNHIQILKQEKENSEHTIKCANTHFNSDSVTVDIMDQLCYIRESVESIKELLSILLKEK